MKIDKDTLFRIIREETAKHIKALTEAEGKEPEVDDASKPEAPEAKKDKPKSKEEKPAPKSKAPEAASDQDVPASPDDEKIEKDVTDPEHNEEAEQSRIQQELEGKAIQGISFEPKSKVLPGAKEVVITFSNSTDPLKILISKSGEVKYFFKNALHNKL